MIKIVNQMLKKLLRRYNRVISFTPYSISGCHFPDDLREVIAKDNPICLDVGGHWGETVQGLQQIFTSPAIHSFEPSRNNCERLRTLESPGKVQVHQIALGATAGTLDLNLYEDSVLHSLLPLDPNGPQGGQTSLGTEKVPVITLDNFLLDHGIHEVDLLKIDTQGYELPVLQGAAGSLAKGKIRAVLLEVNFSSIYSGQSPIFEIFSFLQERGFAFVDFYQKARIGHSLSWCNALFERVPPKQP